MKFEIKSVIGHSERFGLLYNNKYLLRYFHNMYPRIYESIIYAYPSGSWDPRVYLFREFVMTLTLFMLTSCYTNAAYAYTSTMLQGVVCQLPIKHMEFPLLIKLHLTHTHIPNLFILCIQPVPAFKANSLGLSSLLSKVFSKTAGP